MTLRLACRLGCIVALFGGAASAGADEEEDERAARRLYERGLRAFEDKDWDAAIDAFLEAQEKAPAPALHYNIAQAYRLKGDCPRALLEYKRFLREDPQSPNRKKVLVRVAEMQRCVARGNAPAATKREDPATEETTPPDGSGDGDAKGDGGGEPRIEEEEDPLMVPEPKRRRAPPSPGRVMRVAGWISVGVGAGLLIGGYVLGQRASEREGQIDALFDRGGMWSDAYSNLEKDGRNAATMSAISYGVGAASILTGAVLVYFGGKDAERPAVSPMTGARGVNVAWEF
jgi:tetratricopeptide (TPR) repeat protein